MNISLEWFIVVLFIGCTVTAFATHYYHTRGGEFSESNPFKPEIYEPDGDSALPSASVEAQRTLDQALTIHGEQTKKAIQMAQINGLILTILIGVASNFEISGNSRILVMAGGGVFAISTVLAVLGTMGHQMKIGLGPKDVDILVDNDLNDNQYHLWMLNRGYRKWINQGRKKVHKKRMRVKWSILSFLLGVLLVLSGLFISLNVF